MDRKSGGPDLTQHSGTPRYNIGAVERATGVASRTLRSWERRYGVPAPYRDGTARRLYSERDVAVICWLKERVGEGLSISRVVAMLDEDKVPEGNAQVEVDLDRAQLRLLQAIDWMDEDEVWRILQTAAQSLPVERLVLELIQPVLYRVGDLWAAGRFSVASEHLGAHSIRSLLADLLSQSARPWRLYHILVGCAPGEQHDIGALGLALLLRRAGFRVTYLGASLESESLADDLERIRPHALCLSATSATAAAALADLYRAVGGRFSGIAAYGGPAFAGERIEPPMSGLALGVDPLEAVSLLTAALVETERAT